MRKYSTINIELFLNVNFFLKNILILIHYFITIKNIYFVMHDV